MRVRAGIKHGEPQKFKGQPLYDRLSMELSGGNKIRRIGALMDLDKALEERTIGDDDAKKIILRALQDRSVDVSWNAVHVLAKLGLDGIPEMQVALRDERPEVRNMAAAMVHSVLKRLPLATSLHPQFRDLAHELAKGLAAEGCLSEYCRRSLEELAKREPLTILDAVEESGPEADRIRDVARITIVKMTSWRG